ncbi:MAG: Na(+)/H(+) antiporter subunit D [Pseudomonadota bacterium]|nr:Na(+)/H(+) antiporter subunit D [Pseudomonadota bacterium]
MISGLPWGLPPGWVLILGAFLIPLLPRPIKTSYLAILPLVGIYHLGMIDASSIGILRLTGHDLTLARVDGLSRIFAYIFSVAAFFGMVYARALRDDRQHMAALVYAGSGIGAVCAGDLISLFVYWELTALASVFLIWCRGGERAFRAGMRYLMIQVGSGVILLSGLVVRYLGTGDLSFGSIDPASPGAMLILLAFGIKAAFPLLHTWLTDAYPEATPTGTVFLSAFTTKLAIYGLARGFAGTELLIPIGVAMVFFTLLYALLEDDLRRVLAYSLVNQLGFMVIAVGLGTELAINGVAAHAVSHILYKSLLFMTIGAVLFRTGTAKASELGGLYRSMPLTLLFCAIGALGMSAPLFAGFASKSLILSAAAKEHELGIWLTLLFGSVGVFLVAGIKVIWFTFFGSDKGFRCREAPVSMLLGMALTAVALIVLGIKPNLLYGALPYPLDYELYTLEHVITQIQLLVFTGLAFAIALRLGLLKQKAGTLLDADWLYRRGLPVTMMALVKPVDRMWHRSTDLTLTLFGHVRRRLEYHYSEEGRLSETWPTGRMVLWVASLLAAYLLLYQF